MFRSIGVLGLLALGFVYAMPAKKIVAGEGGSWSHTICGAPCWGHNTDDCDACDGGETDSPVINGIGDGWQTYETLDWNTPSDCGWFGMGHCLNPTHIPPGWCQVFALHILPMVKCPSTVLQLQPEGPPPVDPTTGTGTGTGLGGSGS
jgi:hypothetical protein